MPPTITQRVISSHAIPRDAYVDPQEIVLDSVAAYKMVNLLNQIGQLSEFAADIFDALVKEAGGTAARIQQLGSRISSLDGSVPKIEQVFHSQQPTYFYQSSRGKEWHRRQQFSQSLFHPQTQPTPIQKSRAAASPPPNVSLLDTLSKKSCLKDYSNPAFFEEEWVKAEEEKVKKLIEENKTRKDKRQKNRKKKPVKPRQVERVQVKTFNALGAEYSTTPAPAPAIQQPASPPPKAEFEEEEEKEEKDDDEIAAGGPGGLNGTSYANGESSLAPPQFPTQQQQMSSPHQAPLPQAPQYSAPPMSIPPPAPSFSHHAAPPAPSHRAPPPVAPPIIPAAPDAPEAPDLSFYPSAPTPPPAPAAPSFEAEVNVGGLIDNIRTIQLKKPTPVAPKQVDARGGLLTDIRRGAQLRQVKQEEKKPAIAAPASGLGGIMDILARRQAIKGSESDEASGNEDWE